MLEEAFATERRKHWRHLHGTSRRNVVKTPAQLGFVVLERRGVIERTFGWLSQ